MDSSTIKTLLDSQERAYKAALDIVVEQMNEQIHKLESTVSELKTSLEFTQQEVDELKSMKREYDNARKDTTTKMERLHEALESSQQKTKVLEERSNYMEDYSRRNNVRITGVQERNDGETWEQTAVTVTSLLTDKLQLPGLMLERAHRVGQRRDAQPRTIVARFTRYCDRDSVMRNAKKLRGTNIYINDDLCAASQAERNAQMPELKNARAQGKVAYFRHTKLIIKERMRTTTHRNGQRPGPGPGPAAAAAAAAAAGAGAAGAGFAGAAGAAAGTGADGDAGGGGGAAAAGAGAAAAAAAGDGAAAGAGAAVGAGAAGAGGGAAAACTQEGLEAAAVRGSLRVDSATEEVESKQDGVPLLPGGGSGDSVLLPRAVGGADAFPPLTTQHRAATRQATSEIKKNLRKHTKK